MVRASTREGIATLGLDRPEKGNALSVELVAALHAAIDAAIAGTGVTCVLSYQVESAQRARQLELLLRDFEPPPIPVSFLYPGHSHLPLKLRALLDFAVPRLRERLLGADAALNDKTADSKT